MQKLGRLLAVFLTALVLWAGFTENSAVWPVRNTLEYHLVRAWWRLTGEPERSIKGAVAGRVQTNSGQPVAQAVVAVSEWDGCLYTARTDESGFYNIPEVPVGFYRVAVAASGFDAVQTGGLLRGITVRPGGIADASFLLDRTSQRASPVLSHPKAVESKALSCTSPIPGSAIRSTLQFALGGRKEPVFLYRPLQSKTQPLPILFTVYPGPVDTWECVSIGLSQAGYAVLAVGPEYSLDLDMDVDWLLSLLGVVKRGELEGVDSGRVAALGGSYSALLLELLMLRDPNLSAMVLLGPPTDMFDFRRRFEREGFMPPFGLDKALVALGLPNREPLRYLKNSTVYHVRTDLPATILFHSYQDEIVPYQQSRILADSLREVGVDTELHLFDGASHYLLEDGEAAQAIYRRTIDFLIRHGMAPFPVKER